jgi:hypothetical protein
VLYKIAAKCIANRARGLLGEIIGEEQSAFIPGRLITDNVLIAYESVHAMKRRKKGKNTVCAVKLDMMKAYDRVEWHYLHAIMLKLGFSASFVRLILKCVSSVRFTVRVNGELLPYFTPTRGLRQGNPISPYLFLLCGEGFTSLLNRYGGIHVERGIRVSPRSPWINHLLFADDSLIFMKEKVESAQRLSEILQIYGDCSGQQVNRVKSSIFSVQIHLCQFEMISNNIWPSQLKRSANGTWVFLQLWGVLPMVLLTILVKEFVANCMEAWSGWSLVQARRFS